VTTLFDINVLVALAWPNHIHHAAARTWFGRHHREGWATCSLTESGFVRVSSNPKAVDEARTPAEAILMLQRWIALPGHRFWNDDVSMARSAWIAGSRIHGYRQVTDAHLLALAARHEGRVATFDRRIADVLPAGSPPDSVLILPGAAPGRRS
jgi:hypothetical protein